VILFPNEEHIEQIQYPIRRDELEKACEDLPPPKHYWPELIVLITYTYQLAAIRADTGLICQISRNDGTPLLLDEGLSEAEMRISLHRMWGGFAT
jgi:Cys-tRNA synthase (O-phospho-L-seryl-tRNA:Cys-tRNA synthase)